MNHPNVNSVQHEGRLHILAGLLLASLLVLPVENVQSGTPTEQIIGAPGCIQVVKICAYSTNNPTCFQAGANIDFFGYVTNCGITRITNVTIVDCRPLLGAGLLDTNGAPLSQPLTLDPGQAIGFGGSFAPTLAETCAGDATNCMTTRGDIAGVPGAAVTNTTSTTCAICVNPCLTVSKNCNTVTLGQANTVSGAVTNCGNITITNIVISDNLYGTLATIPSLEPGAFQSYSRLVTNSFCGNFPNTVIARGTTVCGQPLQAQAFSICVVTVNACLGVTKTCNAVTVGQPNTVTAVVTNCGSVVVNNILVTDSLYGSIGTIVFLAPGGTATLTKVATNTCGSFTNVVTASGTSPCGEADLVHEQSEGEAFPGTPVQASSTNVCVVTENPCIGVTKTCDTVVTGQANLVTAVLTNCGNVSLHGITVVDNIYGSVGTIALLAPGGTATLTKSVTNTCGNFTNTVIATGLSPCNTSVTNTSIATCVVTENPCIRVTKTCDTVVAGQANLVTAVITNCGNVPLHGITVVDNIYGSVGTIALLAPGGTATLTKSVTNTCGNFTNTVTATGLSPCNTSVTNTSTATCVVTENPCIRVTKTCDTVVAGQANLVTAVITNCGNVPLHGITVVDNIYGSVGTIALLAPGGTATLTKSVTNTCGNFTNTVTATGLSPCNTSVTNTSTATCVVTGCAPRICVTKDVVCETPTGCATNWSSLALGAKAANNSQCPSFCYRFRVTNCGGEGLRNVTVVDDVLNIAACNFPTNLAVGQTFECIVGGVVHCDSITNTVTAAGVGAESGSNVTASATAVVEVRPIEVTCNATVNGQTNITIRCDGEVHLVTNAVQICNTGELPLAISSINGHNGQALGGECTNLANFQISLQPGQCTNVICVEPLFCYPGEVCSFEHQIDITIIATVDTTQTNACSYTRNPSNQVVAVTASCTSSATVVLNADGGRPRIECRGGVNPSGKKIPVAGKNPASGQNPDGYYELLAKDDCDPDPLIYVFDTGSDFVAGPFHSGDVIKLTQSPGKKPSQDSAPDPIVAHLHFKGDAFAIAVDANGNSSYDGEGGGGCLMLVPRPPK